MSDCDDAWKEVVRRDLIANYSEAVPTIEALRLLGALGPIIEIGAGNGYWGRLLQDIGTDVRVTDETPPASCWTEVQAAGYDVALSCPDRVPFVCWPHRPSFVPDLLRRLPQDRIALITDGRAMTFGEYGYDPMYDELEENWREIEEAQLPHWPCRLDKLMIWERR